ncbi:hypothetical protein PIB30_056976 [Stylosanthes scabra]|uniref:Uncharacterized protein n=1 Tax=Stylosanthes scabra TaxID=79078 RepID=A0ABU6RKA7_9FABA|nr:hypothetical protein [Stylosanthes scabra]
METVSGGTLPILRRHQEEAGHDEDQDQVMYEAENFSEPPHQQSYFEHETGAESWANHEYNKKGARINGKRVKEIKEKQINPVDNETLKDVASMTFQQREKLKQIRKQIREWTMYFSARECYDVWAHQQSNPNLVQMPLNDLMKMVYDNLENKRPMFSGALKSDPNAGQVSHPEPIPPEDLHLYNNQQVSFFEE